MKKSSKTNQKEKTNNGITLIALVITIIVLLILVGISIAILTGENGILSKANKAKEENEREAAKEKIQIAVMESYGNDGDLDYDELKSNLNNIDGINHKIDSITKDSFPLDVSVDGYAAVIEKNGNVIIEGEKTGNLPTPQPITIEEAKEQGKVLNETNAITIKDKYDNNVVVPEGFKIASDSAEDVTGGVVIEDVSHGETAGSQFVWIPIGEIKGADEITKMIELNRYTFAKDGTPTKRGDNMINSYFQELATSDKGNTVAKDIEGFKLSVAENGGYYIGRYEAGDPLATEERISTSIKTGTVVSKAGQFVYNWVTQPQAATLARNMYQNKKFTSDLMNSYAWDSAIVFIQEFSGDGDYSRQYGLQQGTLAKTGEATDGRNKDVRCNIYDMAGNTLEWSTETSSYVNASGVNRGGNKNGRDVYTSYRNNDNEVSISLDYSFRLVLYL